MQHLVGTIRGHDHHKLFCVRILAHNNVFGSTGSGSNDWIRTKDPDSLAAGTSRWQLPHRATSVARWYGKGAGGGPTRRVFAVQQSGRDWGTDSASADGINLRDGVTAKLNGRAMRKDCARAQLTHDIRHHIRHHIPHVHLTCGAVTTKDKQNQLLAACESPGVNADICPQP